MKFSPATVLRSAGRSILGRDSQVYVRSARQYRRFRRSINRFARVEPSDSDNKMHIADIASASKDCKPHKNAKRIVFLNIRGWGLHLAADAIMAAQLRQMGHEVSFLWCADSMPFCMLGSSNHAEEHQRNCELCCGAKDVVPGTHFDRDYLPKAQELESLAFKRIETLGIEECRNFVWEGVPYGDLMYRSIGWFLRRSVLTEADAPLYRKALISAHTARMGLEQMVARRKPDAVVMMNGDFSVERVAGFVLKRLGVRFVSQDYAFEDRLGVGVNDSVWDHLTFETETRLNPPPVSEEERSEALKLIQTWRKNGGYQGHLFWDKDELAKKTDVRKQLGLDARPVAAAYTNLTFESSVLGKDRVFANQFEWITALISWFKKHPEYQLVLRTHPAEIRKDHWRPNESLTDFIKTKLSPLPENVHLIGAESNVSSYELGMLARLVIVYSTTLGLELAERGKAVITAAHVHYAKRGFTVDPDSSEEYFRELEAKLVNETGLSEEAHQKLVNYVAWFIFRRLTPFEAVSQVEERWPKINAGNLKALSSPEMKGVQQVCRLIAEGRTWW